MANSVQYYPTAKWATIEGNFTADDLRDIAKRIEDPFLQDTPIDSEVRSQAIIKQTMEDARVRQEARKQYDKD